MSQRTQQYESLHSFTASKFNLLLFLRRRKNDLVSCVAFYYNSHIIQMAFVFAELHPFLVWVCHFEQKPQIGRG